MLHSTFPPTRSEKAAMPRDPALVQRIESLRSRPVVYLGHGDALMLLGLANASLRQQQFAVGNAKEDV